MTTFDQSHSRDDDLSESSAGSLPEFMDCVRVLLLRGDFEQLVMVHDGAQWDLPYFEYSRENSIHDGACIEKVCTDLRDWFQLDSSMHFTAVVELFGDLIMPTKPKSSEEGMGSLYVMEAQHISADELTLPSGAEWKSASFLSGMAESSSCPHMRRVASKAVSYMVSRGVMKDPRFELGWHANVSRFLRSVLLKDDAIGHGNVEQVQVTCRSTIVKLNSSKGWYYAKAPAIGNMESAITTKIAEIFPESSPFVVDASNRLRCFVTREFQDIKPKRAEAHIIVAKLADIQLKSVPHVEALEEAGCPHRSPDALKTQIKHWSECEFVRRVSLIKHRVEHMAPVVVDLCDKLESMEIPYTLVHGDFGFSNCTFTSTDREKVIFFDWEFGCIGHPFCDFQRLYDELPEEGRDEIVDEYLKRWTEFEDMTRLREAFDIARCLGLLLKLWSVSESLESCEHQVFSELQNWCDCLVNFSVSGLCVGNRLEWCD